MSAGPKATGGEAPQKDGEVREARCSRQRRQGTAFHDNSMYQLYVRRGRRRRRQGEWGTEPPCPCSGSDTAV